MEPNPIQRRDQLLQKNEPPPFTKGAAVPSFDPVRQATQRNVDPPAEYNPNPSPERVKTYGKRTDGTPKGPGYFGELPRLDDPSMFSGELSATADLKGRNGKPVLFPLLVPSLTREEVNYLLSTDKLNSGDPKARAMEQAIYQKAETFAAQRMAQGLSPFAGHGEQNQLPTSSGESFHQGFHEEAAKMNP